MPVDAHAGCNTVMRELRICIAEAALCILRVAPEEVVVLRRGCGAEVPAQTDVHGQLLIDLPVVFRVRGEVVVVVGLRIAGYARRAQRTGHKVALSAVEPKHHVGESIACAAKPRWGCATGWRSSRARDRFAVGLDE